MVDPFVSFLILLGLLFLLSRAVSQSLGLLVYRFTRSKRLMINVLAFIFFPGTVIHEFAHAAIAQMIGVRVGEIELMPEIEGANIKLGSAQVEESDPFRSFLIGVAPLIGGFVLIFLTIALYSRFAISGFWPTMLLFYILFEIGNTMFSSKRDMEGALELIAAVALVLGFLYLIGVRQFFGEILSFANNLGPFFKMATSALIKIVVIDVVVVMAARFFNSSK